MTQRVSRTISVADMVVGGVGFGLVRLFVWLLVGLIAIQAFKMGCVDGGPEMQSYELNLFDQIAASVGGLFHFRACNVR